MLLKTLYLCIVKNKTTMKAEDYIYAYKLGRKDKQTGNYHVCWTPAEEVAYVAGYEGKSIDFDDIVTGYRYGAIPESGRSRNYLDDCWEDGLSLAAVDGEEEVASCMWFGDRKKVAVTGIRLPWKGSDGETLVLPIV